jgi:hypothetical protein
LEDPALEAQIYQFLAACTKVDFMDVIEWFLGIHLSWEIMPSLVSVHLNQSGFTSTLAYSFSCESPNPTPTATPYCAGISVDSIAPSQDNDSSPTQIWR